MAIDYERIRSILSTALGGDLGYFTTKTGGIIPALRLDDGTEHLADDYKSVTGLELTIVVNLDLDATQLLGNSMMAEENGFVVLAQHTPGQPILDPTQRAMLALKKGYPNLKVDKPKGTRASAKLDAIASMNFTFSLTSHWVQ